VAIVIVLTAAARRREFVRVARNVNAAKAANVAKIVNVERNVIVV
jgi:hypothetical protein